MVKKFQNNDSDTEFLCGVIERLTYHSAESGYTIARMKLPKAKNLITVVGNFANISAGQTLQLKGNWGEHPKYGLQFKVVQYEETKPATITGIEKYLGSGLIKGVGAKTAKRIVAHFGLKTLDIIETEIARLGEVPGIANKRVASIQAAWIEQKAIKDVMIFLQGHGVSTIYAVKIYKHYGEMAIATVTTNPYQLAVDIQGIGFLTADKIAQNLGVSPWSKSRYRAGILHILSESAESGHCYLPELELVASTTELLTIPGHESDESAVSNIAGEMTQQEQLIRDVDSDDSQLIYKPTFFHTERNLAQLMRQHLSKTQQTDLTRVQTWINNFTRSQNLQLSNQQRIAVEVAASEKITILTGGPGTGKTFTTRTIVALLKAMGKKIGCAAPTGRAAKRLSEMTGIEAKTLHRLLEFDPTTMGFKRDRSNPLPYSAIVVDEVSMLDLFMAYSLMKAVPKNCQLLLVGDCDQLPSVGAGNVLKDLIESKQIKVTKLTQVFRQGVESGIISAAYQINQGQLPTIEPISMNPTSDCLWHVGGNSHSQNVQTICELIEHLMTHMGFNPATDVQVLSPMSRGEVGTSNLNRVLQKLINPPSSMKKQLAFGGDLVFREGDRVMQLKNDYNREVFNGDLGIVSSVDLVEKEITVEIDGREVKYDGADLLNLTLAWATSIHKSQGSEYPVVILPISTQHRILLSRNLLYTGLTRAKKLAIIVGSKSAISMAVNQVGQQQRYTRLTERLVIAGRT